MPSAKLTEQQLKSPACSHTREARAVNWSKRVCGECVKMGDTWVHLRICMICGHIGCCDNSKNRHARAHYERTGHPIVKSIEPGPDWAWCFPDNAYLE